MIQSNMHIIHRINLEIETSGRTVANQLKDSALRLLYTDILPRIEKYLDSLESQGKHIRFDQLDIELDTLQADTFEEEFARLTEQAFRSKIEPVVEKERNDQENDALTLTGKEQVIHCFLFFLETGRLPWWYSRSGNMLSEKNLEEIFTGVSGFVSEKLLPLISKHPAALERLLNQYSPGFIFSCIFSSAQIQPVIDNDSWSGKIIQLLNKIYQITFIQNTPVLHLQQNALKNLTMQIISTKKLLSKQQMQLMIDELSAKIASAEMIDPTELKSLFEEISRKLALSPSSNQEIQALQKSQELSEHIQEPIPKTQNQKLLDEDGIFLNNAGLVLLYPFLESFLGNFGLLENGRFKNTESQTLAIHLLHYLVAKTEQAPEYDLIIEKFLCNWNSDTPIARDVTLTQAMKDESEQLLSAAIRHWSALKNTSPDGLREGFLQREGKLVLNDFQNRLIVENKTQDVLLSFLPWGYSIVKLPWMKNILLVEWN